MKINILNWLTGRVIFEAAIPDDTEERFRVNLAVEMAVRDRARLDGASLVGASLDRARLDGASLAGARLDGASLDGARLDGASLVGARLDGARLVGARLVGASLDGARLDGARLVGARLDGASLDGASLVGARLDGASLDGASLDGARLDGASLVGARLDGANLDGANLDGASLDGGEKLIGKRPVLQFGPIGSESRYAVAYLTDRGLRFRAGCFFGDTAALRAASEHRHGKGSPHNQQYEAFIALAEAHAALWTPASAMEGR